MIPDNADLYSDTYKVPGNYYCPSNVNVVTLKNCPLSKAFILKVDYTNGTQYKWEHDSSIITSADYEAKTIPNSYGLTIVLFTFGSDTIKAIKIGGYINKAMSAGTAYTIATNIAAKSRVEWYHNIHCGINGVNTVAYLRITTDGNIVLTPQTAIASGVGINIAEYYV